LVPEVVSTSGKTCMASSVPSLLSVHFSPMMQLYSSPYPTQLSPLSILNGTLLSLAAAVVAFAVMT
jgi:hypothetical protein